MAIGEIQGQKASANYTMVSCAIASSVALCTNLMSVNVVKNRSKSLLLFWQLQLHPVFKTFLSTHSHFFLGQKHFLCFTSTFPHSFTIWPLHFKLFLKKYFRSYFARSFLLKTNTKTWACRISVNPGS